RRDPADGARDPGPAALLPSDRGRRGADHRRVRPRPTAGGTERRSQPGASRAGFGPGNENRTFPKEGMNVTRGMRLLALLALLAVVTAGAAYASSTAKKATKVSIAFVGADLPDPFYITMHCGASAAAKQFNVSFTWQGTNG